VGNAAQAWCRGASVITKIVLIATRRVAGIDCCVHFDFE
jgi:hypothetical protein